MKTTIETIIMDKKNTIFGTNAKGQNYAQTVENKNLLNVLKNADMTNACFEFCNYDFLTDKQQARDIKKYAKRVNEVANALGLTISELEHPVIDGHTITGKWQYRVIG